MTGAAAAPERPRILRDREFWLLIAGTLLFFSWPLFLGRTYFFRDLYFWSFPQRARLAEMVRAGAVPLWDGLIYGGQPLLGNVQYLALYPTAVLALVLPAVTAVNLEIVLHFALCAAACYALARSLEIPPVSSALAGIVFAFSGVTLSFGNLFGRLLAMPHTALLLLFWHRFLLERRRLWFALATVAGALLIFAGSAEQFAFSLPLAVAWGVVTPYPPDSGSRRRRLALGALLGLAVFALSAVQTLPMLQLVRHSWRGAGLPASERGTWSVNPRRLPELVVPGFFGDTATLRESDYWGAAAEDMGFPILLSIYFGATVLALAFAGALSRTPGPLPRGSRALLGAVLLGSILFSLGRFLPAAGPFDPTLLLGGIFRYPVKFFFATPLPAALLAAHAADTLSHSEASCRARRLVTLALASAALLFVALAAALRWDVHFSEAFQRLFFLRGGPADVRDALARRLLHAGAFAGAAAALFLPARASIRRRIPALLGGLLALDLASAGSRRNPTAPRELLTRVPPLARTVRGEIGDGRFFRDVNPPGIALRAPSNEIRWRYQWNRETLAYYTAAGFGIPLIFQNAFDGLDLARHERLTQSLSRLPWERRLPVLSAASVRLFLTSEDVTVGGVRLLADVPNSSDRLFHLYRNTRSARRAELVHFWRPAASPEEAIRAMAAPGFDPRRHAVIEGQTADPPAGPCTSPAVEPVSSGSSAATWRTRSACDGYLILSEPFDPGWRASVDRAAAPLLPANGMFSAVFLSAGAHEVRRFYRPVPLFVGTTLSLLTLAALFGAVLREPRA